MESSKKQKKISRENIEDSLRKTSEAGLTVEEKSSMLSTLTIHMKEHPMGQTRGIVKSAFFSWSTISWRGAIPAALVALMCLFTVGTVSAAQRSLPGDMLYPVKIHVSEALEEFLTVGAQASASVQAKHAIARLVEAEKLAASGKLSDEKKKEITEAFEEKERNFRFKIGTLLSGDDMLSSSMLNSNFDGELAAHENALIVLGEHNPDSKVALDDIAQIVRGKVSHTLNQEHPDRGVVMRKATKNESENTKNIVKEKIQKIETTLETVGQPADPASLILHAKLDVAKQLQTQGEAELENGNHEAAFNVFIEANKEGQEIQAMYGLQQIVNQIPVIISVPPQSAVQQTQGVSPSINVGL